jgi:hypothetical protein
MACDPQILLADANCYDCMITGRMRDAVEIVLLCAIRDRTVIPITPQALIDQANCIFTCIPPGAMSAVKISLLCQISGL